MKIETVAESFARYRADVMPAEASDVQVLECRRAFYAAAYWMLMHLSSSVGDDSVSEDDGVDHLEQLRVECETFGATGGPPPPRVKGGNSTIEIGSILSARTKEGVVELVLNGEKTQMDLPKAREVRGMLDGAIEAAISDGLLFAFLTTKIGLPEAAAGAALLDFRELRQGSRSTVFPQ